jgi:hypothetical protein
MLIDVVFRACSSRNHAFVYLFMYFFIFLLKSLNFVIPYFISSSTFFKTESMLQVVFQSQRKD